MLEITWTRDDGQRVVERAQAPLSIGRDASCGLRLRGWRIARQHARVYVHEGGVGLDDLGSLAGTWLNGRRIVHQGDVQPSDEVLIGGHVLQFRWHGPSVQATSPSAPAQAILARAPGEPAADTVPRLAADANRISTPSLLTLSAAPAVAKEGTDSSDAMPGALGMSAPMSFALCEPSPLSTPGDHLPSSGTTRSAPAQPSLASADAAGLASPSHLEWRRRLHVRLLEAMDLRRRDVASMSDAALRAEADGLLAGLIAAAQDEMPVGLDRQALRREVVDEAVGLGPLEALLADADISEIMVNRHDEVFVERGGVLARHPVGFSSERAVIGVIERIVAPLGRRIDESAPMVDARLPDGSRVNAVIPPIALHGAALTIRKFPVRRLQAEDLVRAGALDAAMVDFLGLCVRERRNIVVSGGTGSGKTTLLNILSNFVPAGERIVTIEDAAELRLHHAHRVALEARPANVEGRGAVTIRDLVRNALRMRPDRIVVGECRGAEALDMLQAMNTGHAGSLTTLHANTPRDALARLETLVLMAGMDLPLAAVREQIAAAVDVIVQQSRDTAGVRRVVGIVEVAGVESGRIQLQELFRFEDDREGGAFVGAGLLPRHFETWLARGLMRDSTPFFGRTPVPAPTRHLA
ncbi:Flp pilus assembly complex ATPase component TadA [Achromobacter sp. GG226]|uniref:ATPase, T2SS/T4P/T4SS family n=1 Tax=Verticiella alkaliphila TaxID=2779529 RepID=UPI001C0E770B|nr:ATPase, T2SS/T4P/T4SS family [Verticiella sp. GG226]MBU4610122.1 Flp pilus assembly complex ATPase component TadA [Verticiella sp. GG226]